MGDIIISIQILFKFFLILPEMLEGKVEWGVHCGQYQTHCIESKSDLFSRAFANFEQLNFFFEC
jgi:hypothetical protein